MKIVVILVVAGVLLPACSESERQWDAAEASNSIDAYAAYLQAYPDGSHVAEARRRIEGLEWKAALAGRDEKVLLACLEKYPESAEVETAKELLWSIRWPAVEVEKADSVTIFKGDYGTIHGQIVMSMSGMFGGGKRKPPEPGGPNRVFIWRDSAPEDLRPGLAYLKTDDGEYKFIRKVDLDKDDAELCTDFGVDR